MPTTAGISSPPYINTDLDLLWIIANTSEGNTLPPTEDISSIDTTNSACWPTKTQFLYVIANLGANGGGISLSDSKLAYKANWPTELELWYYIANILQGNVPAIALGSITPKENWSTDKELIYIIAQGPGITVPLDIADITYNDCLSTYSQLLYISALNGVELSPIQADLQLWHRYLEEEIFNVRSVDYSPNNHRGILSTATVLEYDGINDYVALTTPMSQATGTWIINLNMYANPPGMYVFGADVADASQYFVYMDRNNVYIRNKNQSIAEAIPTPFGFDNVSYQMAITISATELKLYVDGVLDTTRAISGSTADFFFRNIGTHVGAEFFFGKTGGLKVFNTELTAAEILELYQNPEQIIPTGADAADIELYMPMTAGINATAYDGSGNLNHGTINGAIWQNENEFPFMQMALVDWNEKVGGEILPEGLDPTKDILDVAIVNTKFVDSLNMNGRSRLVITKTASIGWTSDTSLEFWIKVNKDQNNPVFSSLPTEPSLVVGSGLGDTIFYDYNAGAVNSSYTSGAITGDVRHVVVMSSGGDRNKLYINGVLDNENIGAPINNLLNATYNIGTDDTDYFFGEIMVLRIYDESLTDAQVEHNYNSECEDYGLARI